jgi:hypothetical protein
LPLEQNHKVEKEKEWCGVGGLFDIFNNLQTNE